jgi:colicin import membrane protein
MTKRQPRALASSLALGVKEIPRNASWLVGQAVKGATNGTANGSTVVDRARHAGDSIRSVLPGESSVDAHLARARSAAERAQEAEQEALAAAERAQQRAQEAENLSEQEQERFSEIEAEQQREVDRRTAEARRRADEMVAAEQAKAQQDAEAVLERERSKQEERLHRAREDAERAQEEAETSYERATTLLGEARQRADEAAAAATEAAERARAEAEQMARQARAEAEEANQAVADAEELLTVTEQTAAAVTRERRELPAVATLSEMSKAELVKLAAAHGIEGRSSKNKKQLVAALSRRSTKRGGS